MRGLDLATSTGGGHAGRLRSRGDLTAFLMTISREVGADFYMLAAILHDQNRNDVRIVASNWIYDAIQLVGHETIAALAQAPVAASPGARPCPIELRKAPELVGCVGGEEARLLDVLGHAELYPLRIHVGRQRLYMLFSTSEPARLEPATLMRAQLRCCHALSQAPDLIASASHQDPLSDRERECLYWVSEGKTTEEVALILGVSANTVNSYITHAIQKFGATNRAMAVATAIRNGIL